MKPNIYEEVTASIIAQLESVNPFDFETPWFNIGTAPLNAITRKAYRGINHFILGNKPYASKFYASYKQWQAKDCNVEKGQKGTRIVFWNFTEDKDTGEKTAFLRHYTVFNSEQVQGDYARQLEQEKPEAKLNPHEVLEQAEKFTLSYLANERISLINTDRAFYNVAADKISMPLLGQFKDVYSYYSTFLHEITHSTGNANRLNRPLANTFGSKDYAKEELIAELGAAMLCGYLGLDNKPRIDHAQYIANWLTILKSDKRFIISAAGKAQKACDYVIASVIGKPVDTEETLAA